MTYTVYLTSEASTTVEVAASDPDDAIEKACDQVHISLCHQCASKTDLSGEWEPIAVTDDDGETVWEDKTR